MAQEYPGGCRFYGPGLEFATLHEALADMRIRITAPNQVRVRVSLLDGAVIKEWLPETNDSATGAKRDKIETEQDNE